MIDEPVRSVGEFYEARLAGAGKDILRLRSEVKELIDAVGHLLNYVGEWHLPDDCSMCRRSGELWKRHIAADRREGGE